MDAVTWAFLPARRDFGACAADWDGLNRGAFRAHPLLDSRFVALLLEHFGGNREVLAVGSRGGRVGSMLVLTPSKPGIVATFLPSNAPIGVALLGSLQEVPGLLKALPRPAIALELLCQDPDYCCIPQSGRDGLAEVTNYGPTVAIGLQGQFEEYWCSRSGKLQANMARAFKRTARSGIHYAFHAIEDVGEIERAVDRYGELEFNGWKGAAGTAVHRSNVQGRFYRDLLRTFAASDQATVYELRFDDRLVASQMAIGNRFMQVTLKTTYDEALHRHSPGHLLDYLTLQHEFGRRKYATVEFYTNATSEVLRWGTSTRQIQHVTCYRAALWRSLASVVRKTRQAAGASRARPDFDRRGPARR